MRVCSTAAVRIEGDEAHAVRVERAGLATVEDEIRLFVEGDRRAAGQEQLPFGAHRLEQARNGVDVDRVGLMA